MKQRKVAIVIGASGGIGRFVALELDKEGFIVVLVAHNLERLKKVSKGLSKKAYLVSTDISKEKEVISLIKDTTRKFKHIDLLVNCAGTLLFNKCEEMSSTDFNKLVATDFTGAFFCIRESIKQMKKQKQGGQIINISSLAAKIPSFLPGRSVYCAVKAAVGIMLESIQAELSRSGKKIKIATIYPGLVATDSIIKRGTRNLKELKKFALKPEDIVYAVLSIVNQGENSNITEIIIRPLFNTALIERPRS